MRFKRPRIQLKRAPENLFHHLAPGTSLARVREVLGTPHRVDGECHSFAFSDAHVQIGSKDGQSVESIAVVLPELAPRGAKAANAPVDPPDALVLGEALAVQADVFVTGDAALIKLARLRGMPVLSPRQFWDFLRRG